MGLSIHYSGSIRDVALMPQLTEEVQDVCGILGWQYRVVNEDGISGVSFTPPECETVSLNFLPNGELVNLVYLRYNIQPANVKSVKTQYAGVEVHITIIKLLRYLASKYFAAFELDDEGGYRETGDEAVLRRQFGVYGKLLNEVQAAIADLKAEEGDTPEQLADRVEKFLNQRRGSNPLI